MPDIDILQNFEFNIDLDFTVDGGLVALAGTDPTTSAGPDTVTAPSGPDVTTVSPDPGPVAPDPGVVSVLAPPDATAHATTSTDFVSEPMETDGGWFF